MGKQVSFTSCARLFVVSALLSQVNSATTTGSDPASCTGCVLEAGFGIVSYTKVVETVVIATETVQPYVYTYRDGSAVTTQKRIYSPAPKDHDPEKELTWEIPGFDGYKLTWPTTYAIVTSLGGGVKSDQHQRRDASSTSCETKVTKVDIPRPVDYDSLVFKVTDTGYQAAPTIPPAILDYLNGVPHVRKQFDGQLIISCQRIVSAAPGTTVPSFVDPQRLRVRGSYFVRQETTDSDSESSASTTDTSATSDSTTTPKSTSSTTSDPPESSVLPTQAPETGFTTITQLTSTTLPTITASASPERPQSMTESTTSTSSTESSTSTTASESSESSEESSSSTSTSSEPQISVGVTSSAVVIGTSKTLTAGSDTTIGGVPISVPSKASSSVIVIDSTSVPIPHSSLVIVPSATTTLPPLNSSIPTSTLTPPPVGGEAAHLSTLSSTVTWVASLLGFGLWWL